DLPCTATIKSCCAAALEGLLSLISSSFVLTSYRTGDEKHQILILSQRKIELIGKEQPEKMEKLHGKKKKWSREEIIYFMTLENGSISVKCVGVTYSCIRSTVLHPNLIPRTRKRESDSSLWLTESRKTLLSQP